MIQHCVHCDRPISRHNGALSVICSFCLEPSDQFGKRDYPDSSPETLTITRSQVLEACAKAWDMGFTNWSIYDYARSVSRILGFKEE